MLSQSISSGHPQKLSCQTGWQRHQSHQCFPSDINDHIIDQYTKLIWKWWKATNLNFKSWWMQQNGWRFTQKTSVMPSFCGRCWKSHHCSGYDANRSNPCHDNRNNKRYILQMEAHSGGEQTWHNWKDHFDDAFNELKELNAITRDLDMEPTI